MSSDNKAIVLRFYSELDQQHYSVFDELCTDDFLSHFPGRAVAQDREERRRTSSSFYEAFPDLRHSIEDLISEGDKVSARLTVRGTHRAPFMGYEPTGRPIEFAAMRVYRIVDGRLAEEWVSFDSVGLLKQLGATIT